MSWKVIKNESSCKKATKRTIAIFDAPEGDELELLLVLVKDDEDKNIHLPMIDTIEAI